MRPPDYERSSFAGDDVQELRDILQGKSMNTLLGPDGGYLVQIGRFGLHSGVGEA